MKHVFARKLTCYFLGIYIILTIIPRGRVGYEMLAANETRSAELAIIISYPTSASGIIVLLKTPTKYREFFPTLFVKTTNFQLVFNFEQTRTVTIFAGHGIMAHIPWWLKPIRSLGIFNNRALAHSRSLRKQPTFHVATSGFPSK